MSTPTKSQDLTVEDLEAGYQHDEWLGFGYLGDRQRGPWSPEQIATADAAVLRIANGLGWNREQLFTWANSKLGRWYSDETLGSPANDVDALAARYVRRPY